MDILRRCAALVAAYAVALQMVLSAFAVAPLAAGFVICRGDSATPPAGDIAHDPCAACVAHCAGAAAPTRDAVALAWPAGAAPTGASPARFAPRLTLHSGGHSPRAPPFG